MPANLDIARNIGHSIDSQQETIHSIVVFNT